MAKAHLGSYPRGAPIPPEPGLDTWKPPVREGDPGVVIARQTLPPEILNRPVAETTLYPRPTNYGPMHQQLNPSLIEQVRRAEEEEAEGKKAITIKSGKGKKLVVKTADGKTVTTTGIRVSAVSRMPKVKLPKPPKGKAPKARFGSQRVGGIYRTRIGRGTVVSRRRL